MASRKLRLSGPADKFELAEVFSSGGQLCKERRLEDMDNPVGIQLLWPKVINAEVDRGMGLFTGYRSDPPPLPYPPHPTPRPSASLSFVACVCGTSGGSSRVDGDGEAPTVFASDAEPEEGVC